MPTSYLLLGRLLRPAPRGARGEKQAHRMHIVFLLGKGVHNTYSLCPPRYYTYYSLPAFPPYFTATSWRWRSLLTIPTAYLLCLLHTYYAYLLRTIPTSYTYYTYCLLTTYSTTSYTYCLLTMLTYYLLYLLTITIPAFFLCLPVQHSRELVVKARRTQTEPFNREELKHVVYLFNFLPR